MGNCLDSQRPATWAEDEEDGYWEWEPMESSKSAHHRQQKKESSPMAGAAEIKIKIKISKKQLEELLRQVDSERVPLRRALFDLASGCAELSWKDQQRQQVFLHRHHHGQLTTGHWKPELQSIPEVTE